jgi:hypothetical protein
MPASLEHLHLARAVKLDLSEVKREEIPQVLPPTLFSFLRKSSGTWSRRAKFFSAQITRRTEAQQAHNISAILGKHALITVISNPMSVDRKLLVGVARRTFREARKLKDHQKVESLMRGIEQTPVRNEEARDIIMDILSNVKKQRILRAAIVQNIKPRKAEKVQPQPGSSDKEEKLVDVVEEATGIATDVITEAMYYNPDSVINGLSEMCNGCDLGGCDCNC